MDWVWLYTFGVLDATQRFWIWQEQALKFKEYTVVFIGWYTCKILLLSLSVHWSVGTSSLLRSCCVYKPPSKKLRLQLTPLRRIKAPPNKNTKKFCSPEPRPPARRASRERASRGRRPARRGISRWPARGAADLRPACQCRRTPPR
jgi:hypothetical protein